MLLFSVSDADGVKQDSSRLDVVVVGAVTAVGAELKTQSQAAVVVVLAVLAVLAADLRGSERRAAIEGFGVVVRIRQQREDSRTEERVDEG